MSCSTRNNWDLKETLSLAPIFKQPNIKRPFQPHRYWSLLRIGVVWTQKNDGDNGVYNCLCFINPWWCKGQVLIFQERVWVLTHFRVYLYEQSLMMMTSHQPLKWLMEFDKLTRKLLDGPYCYKNFTLRLLTRQNW